MAFFRGFLNPRTQRTPAGPTALGKKSFPSSRYQCPETPSFVALVLDVALIINAMQAPRGVVLINATAVRAFIHFLKDAIIYFLVPSLSAPAPDVLCFILLRFVFHVRVSRLFSPFSPSRGMAFPVFPLALGCFPPSLFLATAETDETPIRSSHPSVIRALAMVLLHLFSERSHACIVVSFIHLILPSFLFLLTNSLHRPICISCYPACVHLRVCTSVRVCFKMVDRGRRSNLLQRRGNIFP